MTKLAPSISNGPPALGSATVAAGRGADAAVLDGCSVLWPGAVAFTATGSLTAALTVAAVACAARFLWIGGIRATTDRLRQAASEALARGDDRRARSIYERLWVTRASGLAQGANEDHDGDRLGFSICLDRMGEHRRAALMLLEVPLATWAGRPEFHRRLELLARRLAERLVEGRRPRLARRMLELSLRCSEWRSRVPGQDLRTPAREAGWIWLRLGEGEEAATCFLRALRAPVESTNPGGGAGDVRTGSGATMDTGPYRVCTTAMEVGRLTDDSAALGLAEAYLLSGDHRAALTEFAQLTRSTRTGQADDSPLARGRAERGRARALALAGRIREAIDAYDVAFRWDMRGDLSAGAAILDCLERARLMTEVGDEGHALQLVETATVLAVSREQRAMVDAFRRGQPLPSAQTRWLDVPRLPGEATRRRVAARERRRLHALADASETDEGLPPHPPRNVVGT